MENYKKEKLIGSGTYGTIWLVKSRLTRISYCMKEIDMISLNEIEKKKTLIEVTVLSKCKHKNIIRYKDAIVDHAAGRLSIIMEYADGGDLATAILKQHGTPFNEDVILSWFIQLCLALQYLHFQNILHRDFKTQNIFLTKNKTIKVGDFGIARILRNPEDLALTSIGTPYYMSPEIIKRKPYNFKSDMWSLGCVLFEMSALQLPFKASTLFQLMNVILEGRRTEFPPSCSSLVKRMVQDLLRDDPDLRPSTEEILAYPLLQPYLSNYVRQPVSRESNSLDVKNVSTPRLLKNTKDLFGKRAASECTPDAAKHLATSEKWEVVQRKALSRSVDVSAAERGHSAERKRMNTKKFAFPLKKSFKASIMSPKHRNLPRNTSTMDTTYIVATKSVKNRSSIKSESEMQSDSMCTTKDIDGGYHSAEGILCSSDDKISGTTSLNENISGQSTNESEVFAGTTSGVHNTLLDLESVSFESTFSRSKGRYSDHFNCKHSQCNQCMIDMLWKNRIRGCVETTESQSDYLILKDKLSLIFENDLFQKVYQSLLCDWNGSEMGESRVAIKCFAKTLNYEQVQHLPLMMQLIQLDLLKKQLGERKKSTSDDVVFV